jgi:phosphate:Na+ symporter
MFRSINFVFILSMLTMPFLYAEQVENAIKTDHEFSSDDLINVSAKPSEESAKITWSIDHEAYEILKSQGAKLIITYNTKIGKKRDKEGFKGGEWMYSEPIDLEKTSYTLNDLVGHESYYFKVGFAPGENVSEVKGNKDKMIWSEEAKCKTERGWGIAKLLILIGSLGFFIYGMKIMSEGIQQAAGNKLRQMLGSITSNRVKGVFTGFGITSIVQSSSVTTVMTVSFVNAGLMTLRQSAGVMMGANIGTTITGWLVLVLGFKVSISSYALMIIAFAAPLLFLNKGKAKAWANFLFGFSILFLGLSFLKDSVPTLDEGSAIVQFFIDYKDVWYGSIMFVMLGALVTIVIQSSSAAMTLTLTMASTGIIPFEVACAMVLGENIGTTITAELASLIANVHAKRSARIHSMFNLVGVAWMLILLPFFLDLVGYIVGGSNFDPANTEMSTTGITLFHTMFNLANVLLLIWFVPQIVSLAERSVRSKGDADEEFKLDYIIGPLGSTAELNILEAKKEVAKFGHITSKMNKFTHQYLNSTERKKKKKMLRKLEKYEEITDRVEIEISDFLGKTSRLEMSSGASMQMRGMMNISTDLERIGDIFFQIGKAIERKDNDKLYFTPEQRNNLNQMINLVDEAFEIMNENLNSEYGTISLDKAISKEHEINQLRDQLREEYLHQISDGENLENAMIYSNIFSSLEKVGDHIINVSEHVAGKNYD